MPTVFMIDDKNDCPKN